tara:strand:+ start:1483 stop:3024 length:1542 start_codon:yes stop_codon:yes gene_type:complete
MVEGLDKLADIQALREAAQRPPAEVQQMQMPSPQAGLQSLGQQEVDMATGMPISFSPADAVSQVATVAGQYAMANPQKTAPFAAALAAFGAGSEAANMIDKRVEAESKRENLDAVKNVATSLPDRTRTNMPAMAMPVQEEIQVSEAPFEQRGLASMMTMKEGGSLGQLDNKSLEDLRKAILIRESSGNYSAINKQGFAGGYQFGAAALETLGYLKKGSSKKGNKALKNSKNWTGKGNVKNLNEFLKNEKLQDKIFKDNAKFNYRELKKNNYLFPNNSKEHVSGMLAASHLLGAKGAMDSLENQDANKVRGIDYYTLGQQAVIPFKESNLEDDRKESEVTNEFIVKKGDNLFNIAQATGLKLSELKEANPQLRERKEDYSLIYEGEKINLPSASEDTNFLSDISSAITRAEQAAAKLREGGDVGEYFEGQVEGKGDGMSDEIPFRVEGGNPDFALLSKDEYVIPADVVSMLGNGSSDAGADELDDFVKDTRKEAFGREKQQTEIDAGKGLSSLS